MTNAMITGWEPLPLEQWDADMNAAIETIRTVGREIVEKHSTASERAAEISDHWKLGERQEAEHDALLDMLGAVKQVSVALSAVIEQASIEKMNHAAETIEENLPVIEETFVTIRHAALDLLRWTRRSGHLDDSDLPEKYRQSYAALISYTPQFRPKLLLLLNKLLEWAHHVDSDPAVQKLLSAITRYHGVLDTARGFVRAIVDPPLELVFQETQGLVEEWEKLDYPIRAALGTELNDICQFLLYDKEKFEAGVEEVHHQVAEGIDASLFAVACEGHKVLFSVDEDPLFGQLTVTLYRAVASEAFDETCEDLFDKLYHELR